MNRFLVLLIAFLATTELCAQEYQVQEVVFESGQTKFAGSIVSPKTNKAHAAVVFVHGSGPQTRSIYWAKRFAGQGIVALVYDKRGVGQSGGEYESKQSVSEKNINLLADDAVAAFNALKKHPQTKGLKLGYTGISQAGWIVPIAAEKSQSLDFIALWSAPVCKVSEEDIFSKYTSDLDGERVPSYVEALNARTEKYYWPDFLGKDSNPSDHLKNLNLPGLWIFGAKDGSVPVDLSIQRLNRLSESGLPYEYILFSNSGHNNMPESFTTVTDWVGRLSNPN